MYGNTSTTNIGNNLSIMMKVSAGIFIINALVNVLNFFNYEFIGSRDISILFFITNAVAIAIFLVVLIMMYTLDNEKSGKLIGGAIVLIIYVIGWGMYYFSPSIGLFIDLFLLSAIYFVKAVGFFVVNSGFKDMRRGLESPVIWLYGLTQFVMLLLYIGSAFTFWFFMDIIYYVTDWLDAILLMVFAVILFRNSSKVTKAARPTVSQAYTPYAPVSTQPSYSTYQTPVQQQPTQPMQSEAPPQAIASSAVCTNCGANLDSGEKFCTNCGSKVE